MSNWWFVCLFFLTSVSVIHGQVPPKTPVLTGFEPAAVGSNHELVCDASQPDSGTITYKWYIYSIDTDGVENWEFKGPIGTSQKFVFNPVTETKVFHTDGSEEQVSGKYKCRASNSAGSRDSEWGDLYVYTQCSLYYKVSVSTAYPAIRSTFTLNCYIPNPSRLIVNWNKKADALSADSIIASADGQRCHAPVRSRYRWINCSALPIFKSAPRTFNLQVTNAQPSDSGYWTCVDIGRVCISYPVMPLIQAPPGTPQITGFPSGPAIAGTLISLKCAAEPSGDTCDWYKDGTKVTTSLSYDFLVRKESAGVYKGVTRNHHGFETSSGRTLVVYYKADSVVVSSGKTSSFVGETDTFTCTVIGGDPTPTLVKIYFKRSGETPVEVTQGQDRVMAIEDDQAEYYCEAKVTGYPALDTTSIRKTYNVTVESSIIGLAVGLTIGILALLAAIIIAIVVIIRRRRRRAALLSIVTTYEQSLLMHDAPRNKEMNMLEEEEKEKALEDKKKPKEKKKPEEKKKPSDKKVEEKKEEAKPAEPEKKDPPKFTQKLKAMTVEEGEKADFICKLTGAEPITVKWSKSRKRVQQSKINSFSYANGVAKFHIDEIFPEDKGTVECEAVNQYGKARTTCVLDVKESRGSGTDRDARVLSPVGFRSGSPSPTVTKSNKASPGYPTKKSILSTTGKRPFAPRSPGDISIGAVVEFSWQRGKTSKGLVRYVGHLPGKHGIYLGLELEDEAGKHDGMYNNERYFTCKPNQGVFVVFNKIVMCWV